MYSNNRVVYRGRKGMCVGRAGVGGDGSTGFLSERRAAGSADAPSKKRKKKNQLMSPVKPFKTNLLLEMTPPRPPSGASMLALPRARHRVRPQKHNA